VSDERPRRPSTKLDTLVVEVPIFTEAELRELERRCEAVLATTTQLRLETRRILRAVQATVDRFGGPAPAPAPPPLRVIGPNERPRKRRR